MSKEEYITLATFAVVVIGNLYVLWITIRDSKISMKMHNEVIAKHNKAVEELNKARVDYIYIDIDGELEPAPEGTFNTDEHTLVVKFKNKDQYASNENI